MTDLAAAVAPGAFVHATAIVERGVTIGAGTKVWDNAHLRGPDTVIGEQCLIGGKALVAPSVRIGNRTKLNSFAYVCSAVTIGDGVFVAAGATFTNDVFPRAATPDLSEPWTSDIDEHTLPTFVEDGVSIGARAVIGCDLRIGRFAMVGMGSIVTRDVPAFHLVIGSPARTIGAVCRCGQPIVRIAAGEALPDGDFACRACDRRYTIAHDEVRERV